MSVTDAEGNRSKDLQTFISHIAPSPATTQEEPKNLFDPRDDNQSILDAPFSDSDCTFNTIPHFNAPIHHTPEPFSLKRDLKPQAGPFQAASELKASLQNARLTMDSVCNFIEILKTTMKMDGTNNELLVDNTISRMEDLFLTIITMSSMQNTAAMLAPIMAYFKTWCPGSMYRRLQTMILDIMDAEEDNPLEVQAGFMSDNFLSLTKGSFGKKVSQIINLMIMAGFMPEKMETFIGEEFYKMFSVQATSKSMRSSSLMEYVFTTVDWFVSSVIPACISGDLSLLFSADDMYLIDKMYQDTVNAVDLWTSGQVETAKKKYEIMNEADLLLRLEDCANAHRSILKHTTDDALRREVNSRMLKLQHISSDITAAWHSSGIRVKPFAVLIRGKSSVAKSQLVTIINHMISNANGFPEGDQYSCTINGNDKYQSNYRTHHVTVTFDDMGNTRYERAEGNPLFVLIQFINNMHCAAMSPEAEKKGKNDIRCKIVLVTTNTDDLGSLYFSNSPASIMRRFDLVIDVTLLESALDSEGNIDKKFLTNSMPNIWKLRVSRVHLNRGGRGSDEYSLKTMLEDGDITELIPIVRERSMAHFKGQDELVSAQTDIHKLDRCEEHTYMPMPCAMCAKKNSLQCQGFFTKKDTNPRTLAEGEPEFERIDDPVFDCEEMDGFERHSPMERIRACIKLPTIDLQSLRVACVAAMRDKNTRYKFVVGLGAAVTAMGGIAFMMRKPSPQGLAFSMVERDARKPANLKDRDENYLNTKRCKELVTTTMNHVAAAISTPLSKFLMKVDKNLMSCEFQAIDPVDRTAQSDVAVCNIVPVGGGWWLAPGHSFPVDVTIKVLARVQAKGIVGAKVVREIVDNSNRVPILGMDAVLIFLKAAGDNYDFSKFFLDSTRVEANTEIMVYHRDPKCADPSTTAFKGVIAAVGDVEVPTIGSYNAVDCKYVKPTFKGLCGGLLVSSSKNPTIVGIHLAGDNYRGVAGLITQKMIQETKDMHRSMLKISSTSEVLLRNLPDVGLSENVHIKSPVSKVPFDIEDPSFEVLGQHGIATSNFRSSVTKSCISELVESVMEIPCKHTVPDAECAKKSYKDDLLKIASAKPSPIPEVLARSVEDFKIKIAQFVKENPKFKDYIHTLDFNAAINGADGVAGIDKINVNTSVGWPHNIKKIKLMLRKAKLHITSGNEVEYEFDEDKINMPQLCEDQLTSFHKGERIDCVVRANGKDEPISFKKFAKKKIRIFAGAGTDMVIVARMLFLPTISAISYYPEIFESMVGINPTGRDWAWFEKHITKFGTHRMLNGDFEAFDKQTDSPFTSGAWEIVIFICKICGVSDDVIKMMEGIATECTYPIYEMQGVLVKVFGSNPSGHALTVVINGFVNSLYMRYAYYMMHWRELPSGSPFSKVNIPLFHLMVCLVTFGDDNNASVSPDESLFNHSSVKHELAIIGLNYTMADKEAESVPFICADEVDFIKRKLGNHPQMNVPVGNLDLDSIAKMLHMSKKTRGDVEFSEAQITGEIMRNALAEFYWHSQEMYDERLPQLQAIADVALDGDGHKVSDFFVPQTIDELQKQYFSTVCTYGKPINDRDLETQSGVYEDFDPSEFDEYAYAHKQRFVGSGARLHAIITGDEPPDETGMIIPIQAMGEYRSQEFFSFRDVYTLTDLLHEHYCQRMRHHRHIKRVCTDILHLNELINRRTIHIKGPTPVVWSKISHSYRFSGKLDAFQLMVRSNINFLPLPDNVINIVAEYLRSPGDPVLRNIEYIANQTGQVVSEAHQLILGAPARNVFAEYRLQFCWRHMHLYVIYRRFDEGRWVTADHAPGCEARMFREIENIRIRALWREYHGERHGIIEMYGRDSPRALRKLNRVTYAALLDGITL